MFPEDHPIFGFGPLEGGRRPGRCYKWAGNERNANAATLAVAGRQVVRVRVGGPIFASVVR